MKNLFVTVFVLFLIALVWQAVSSPDSHWSPLAILSQLRNGAGVTGVEREWTEKEIAADRHGYSQYLTRRCDGLEADCKTGLENISKIIEDLDSSRQNNAEALKDTEKALVSLCTSYAHAQASHSWPVSVSGVERDEKSLKQLIEKTKGRLDQRNQLAKNIQQYYEEKVEQAEALKVKLDVIGYSRIMLTDKTEPFRLEEILQSFEQLQGEVHAVAETDTEQLVHKVMEDIGTKLTDDQFHDVISHYATPAPAPAQSSKTSSKNTVTPVPSGNKTTPSGGQQPSAGNQPRKTLTPAQKAAAINSGTAPASQQPFAGNQPVKTLTPAQKAALNR